ncbi:MAG: sulfate transporter CysZ [Cycloclasticus sp.]|nr:cysteine biosynthesis protein CysZ [Cycloclasticus sp. 44_32_T64]
MNIESQSLTHGIRSFIAGINLIRLPGLRRFVIIPLLVNIALFSVASWLLWHYLSTAVDSMLPSWLSWLAWLIIPIFMTSVLAIVYYCFTLVANIIAAPFYGQLSKGVEAYLKGEPYVDMRSEHFLKEVFQMLGSELRKISYYLVRALPLLVLSVIPGVNVISLPLWLLFSAWFLTFEYAGYSFENHKVLFKEQKRILNQSQVNGMSFGGMSLLATVIPVVNLFAPAIAVAGATKMLYERGELD